MPYDPELDPHREHGPDPDPRIDGFGNETQYGHELREMQEKEDRERNDTGDAAA